MTDQQLKKLASMTLVNARITTALGASYAWMFEQLLPLLPDQAQSRELLSDLRLLRTLAADLAPDLEQVRKELGLE